MNQLAKLQAALATQTAKRQQLEALLEASIRMVHASPCDPDATAASLEAWNHYVRELNKANDAGVLPFPLEKYCLKYIIHKHIK